MVVPPPPVQATQHALLQSLDQRLRDKCSRVAHWHAPSRDTPTDHALQLARVGQLPQLLTQQRQELERCGEEVREMRRENRELVARKHQVSVVLGIQTSSVAVRSRPYNFE